jgi:CHAT domain-containing protein
MARWFAPLAVLLLLGGGGASLPLGADEAAPTEIDRIRARLVPGDVFVRLAPDASAEPQQALVIAPGLPPKLHRQPNALVEACEALRAACRKQAPAREVARASEALRELVVEPLEFPMETRRLIVATEGVLSQAPWSLIVPEFPVTLISSSKAYASLLERPAAPASDVLALGDPAYGVAEPAPVGEPAPAKKRLRRLRALPGTRDEALAVSATALLGADASETRLRAALLRETPWRAVHLACHGRFDPEQPSLSWLALAADGEHDGRLTVLEAFGLTLRAELLTLSASESACGRLVTGEAPIGFPSALLQAGAQRVLGALWREVDDAATTALMREFYRLWTGPHADGPALPACEALRQAQAFVRSHERWEHPYYWAAWVLWGLP